MGIIMQWDEVSYYIRALRRKVSYGVVFYLFNADYSYECQECNNKYTGLCKNGETSVYGGSSDYTYCSFVYCILYI